MTKPSCEDLLWHAFEVAKAGGQDDSSIALHLYKIFEGELYQNTWSVAGMRLRFMTMVYDKKVLNFPDRLKCCSDVLYVCTPGELNEIQTKLKSFCQVMHKLKMAKADANLLPEFGKWQEGWQNLVHPLECPFCHTKVCGADWWHKHVMSNECSESFLHL